jgi:hypothetical protein
LFDNLPSDIGNHWSVAVQLAGVSGIADQGVEVSLDMYPTAILGVPDVLAVEEVEEDIGADLIHRPGLVFGVKTAGEVVDPAGGRGDPVWGQVETEKVAGPIAGGLGDQAAIFDCLLVAFLGAVGVGFDHFTLQAGFQLTGGQPARGLDDSFHHPTRDRIGEVGGGAADRLGPTQIDSPVGEGFPDPGEAALQFEGQRQLGFRGTASEPQRNLDLGGGCLQAVLGMVLAHGVDDGGHGPVQLGVVEGALPLLGAQHGDAVIGGDVVDVDTRQDATQLRAGLEVVEVRRDRFVLLIEHMFVS